MKNLLLTGIAVLLAISAAYAADEELPPVAAPPVQAAPIHRFLLWVGSMAHTRCVEIHRVVLPGL